MNARFLATIFVVSVILSTSIIISSVVLGTYDRYALVGSENTCFRLDKKTGQVWRILGHGMTEVVEENSK
jgi:hypothetical protein